MAAKNPLSPRDQLRRNLEKAKSRFWTATRHFLLVTGFRQRVVERGAFAETKAGISAGDSIAVSNTLQCIRDAIDANAIHEAWRDDREFCNAIEAKIQEDVLAGIDQPWPVLPKEILELTIEQLAYATEVDFDEAYASFIDNILGRISSNQSSRRWFSIGAMNDIMSIDDFTYETIIPISSSMSLAISGLHFKTPDAERSDPMWDESLEQCYIQLEIIGDASHDAINKVVDNAYDIGNCLSLPMRIDYITLTDKQIYKKHEPWKDIFSLPGDQDGADCVEEDVADDDPIDNDDLVSSAKNYVSFLGNAIAIGLRGPEKKKGDLLDNCIAVSVALLLESERVWLAGR